MCLKTDVFYLRQQDDDWEYDPKNVAKHSPGLVFTGDVRIDYFSSIIFPPFQLIVLLCCYVAELEFILAQQSPNGKWFSNGLKQDVLK